MATFLFLPSTLLIWVPVLVICSRNNALAFGVGPTQVSSRSAHLRSFRRGGQKPRFSTSIDEENEVESAPTVNAATNRTSCDCLYIEQRDYSDGTRPESALLLGLNNFQRQGGSILREALAAIGIRPENYVDPDSMPPNCLGLTLDSEAVREAERRREARAGEKVEANPISRALYDVGCYCLDELFEDRPIARFWFLEKIARYETSRKALLSACTCDLFASIGKHVDVRLHT